MSYPIDTVGEGYTSGGVLLSFVALFFLIWAIYSSIEHRSIRWIPVVIVSILSIMVFLCFYQKQKITDELTKDLHETVATEKITSLRDNNGVSGEINGRRYYSKGYIESTMYFTYVIDLGDHYKVGQIPSKRTDIYETDDGNYRVEWVRSVANYKKWSWESPYKWRLYVPPNSMVEGYEITLD